MNKTYFAPTTSEVEFAGNSCMQAVSGTPAAPPQDPGLSAPARKLYV